MKKEKKKPHQKNNLKVAQNTFKDLEVQEERESVEIEVINLEETVPLMIRLDEKYHVLMTKPGGWYKIHGLEKIVFSSGEFKFNDVLNEFDPERQEGLLQLSDESAGEENANIYSMIKSLGLRADEVRPFHSLLHQYAPMIVESKSLRIEESYPPWSDRVYEVLYAAIEAPEHTILITGNKNSGKSTLSEFALDYLYERGREVCLLDLDLGKGRGLPGTVNLYAHSKDADETIIYWVGEYTPLNYYKLYVESVRKLVQTFRAKYFNHVLLVNTMGYLTGFGEIVMKEVYDIIDPTQVLFLNKQQERSQFEALKTYLTSDLSKALGTEQKHKLKSFKFIFNPHAGSKSNVEHRSRKYQEHLGFTSLQSFFQRKLTEVKYHDIYIQTQSGDIVKKPFNPFYTNLSLLVICDQEGYLFRLRGLGYGFQDKIFAEQRGQVCIKSETGEFQKQFYDIGEKELISLEQTSGCQSPFILPSYRGLGMMGYRNLASKNIRI